MKRLLIASALLASTTSAWGAAPQDSSNLRGPAPMGNIQDWLADKDEPAKTSWTDVAGPVHFALSVSAKGHVLECLIEQSSGSTQLDDTICYRLRNRAAFKPAIGKTGKPVLGFFRGDFAGGAASVTPRVEMALGVEKMPRGLADPSVVDIAVSVDDKGKVDGCNPADASLLGETACAEAVKSLKLNPARTVQGRAGSSVQTTRVLFTADDATFAAAVADPAGAKPPVLASSMAAGNGDAIIVRGSQIVGKREAVIPYRGFSPIKDFEPIGYEQVLLEAQGGKWYRAKLVPPCIGNSSMIWENGRQPSMGFVTHADGTFDRFSEVYVRGLAPPMWNGRCEIESLVESAPPKIVKARMKADRAARIAAKR